jgi:hypothetical protein
MKEVYIARNIVSSKPQLHSTFLPTVYYLCFLFNSFCFEMLAPGLVILINFLSHSRHIVGILSQSTLQLRTLQCTMHSHFCFPCDTTVEVTPLSYEENKCMH